MDGSRELDEERQSSVGDEIEASFDASPYDSDTEDVDLDEFIKSLSRDVNQWDVYQVESFIVEQIGDGFFGEIFKATEAKTGDVMVMKTMKKASKMKLMCAEIRLMARLNHPNILKFFGVCIDKAAIHLLTAYMDIGNLEEVVLDAKEPLPWSLRMKLAHDISKGMAYLHKIGVIHRDLASKNILISNETDGYLAVVGDFGLAAKIPSRKTKLNVVGSPYWMAPEVLRHDQYNETVDIFSYGIILCEIIGRVHSCPEEIPRTNQYGLDVDKFREIVEGCPPEFLQLAVCCCQLEPDSRPPFEVIAKFLEYLRQLNIVEGSLIKLTSDNCAGSRRMSANIEDWIAESRKIMEPSFPPCSETCTCDDGNVVVTDDDAPKKEKVPCDDGKHDIDHNSATPCRRGHSSSKRNSIFSGIRYKYFKSSVVTEDLVKNTPSKLAGFFNRVLHVQKKHRFDGSKKKSKTADPANDERPRLRSYRLFTASKDKNPSDVQPQPAAVNAHMDEVDGARIESALSSDGDDFLEGLPWYPAKSTNSLVSDTPSEPSRSNSRASSCDIVERRPIAVSPVPYDVGDECSCETNNLFLMSWPQSSFPNAAIVSNGADVNGCCKAATPITRCYSASDVRAGSEVGLGRSKTLNTRQHSKATKTKKYWNFFNFFQKRGKEKQNT